MKKVLVTGFGPFEGEVVNPALEAIKLLSGKVVANHLVVTREVPVIGHDCITTIIGYIKELDPVLVIAVGQAGGRFEITPERVAINVNDYRITDNAGKQPVDEAILLTGPAAYWSTLPIKAIVSHLREQGIPSSVSNSAGTFVCNTIFYGLMHYLATEGSRRRGGFIHIPYLPEQAARLTNQPSMGLMTIVKGLEVAVEVAIIHQVDYQITGGTIC